jgi:hypothetical protein
MTAYHRLPASLLAEPDPFDDLEVDERAEPTDGPSRPRSVPTVGEVAGRIRPTVLAVDRTLPVLPALAGLFPGGLRRGTTIGVSGMGARSLAMALMVRATAAGSWVAVVGDPDLGLAAAAGQGLKMERLVIVDAPDPTGWGPVVATLVGAFDLIVVAPRHRVGAVDVRRLAARCRERGSVLFHLGDGPWPGRLDLRLVVDGAIWDGPDAGHGRLCSRRTVVTASGRGMESTGRRTELLLPGPDGTTSGA